MIRRIVRLIIDRAAAKKAEQETREALDKGTDPRKPTQNLGKIERSMNGLVSLAKKAAAAFAGIWAVKKVFEYGKAVFQLGANVRAVQSQFNTVFGQSRGIMSSFVEDFRRIAGLTRRDAQRIAASAGSMAQGLGASEEAAAGFAEEVLRLSGDLASFNDVPTAEAAKLVQSALIGNTEAARSLQVAFTAADVQARALANTGKASASELTQLEKVMAGLEVITARAGPQMGDLARTQNDADNQAKQLAGSFANLRETLAAAIVGGASGTTIFGDLRDVFDNLAVRVEDNSAAIGAWARVIIPTGKAVFETMRFVARTVINSFDVVGTSLALVWLRLRRGFSQTVNFILEGLDMIPGVHLEFRMNELSPEEFAARQRLLLDDIAGDAGDLKDALSDLAFAYRDVGTAAADAARTQGSALGAPAAAGGLGVGGGGGGGSGAGIGAPGVTGPAIGTDFLAGAEQALVTQTADIAENMRSALRANNPFQELTEQADLTAAFMREGFSGVGEAIVKDLIAGRAEEQFASGLAALASGTWPPNPAALAAAGKHFAAAAAFRALGAALSGGGGGGGGSVGGSSVGPGRVGTSTPSSQDVPSAVLNIFLDPLSPADPNFQRVVQGATQNAKERFGQNVKVNVRPRTQGV